MFETNIKIDVREANALTSKFITIRLINYCQSILMSELSGYTNEECFAKDYEDVIELCRRCLVHVVNALDDKDDTWNAIIRKLEWFSPEFKSAVADKDPYQVKAFITNVFDKLIADTDQKFDREELLVLSAVVRYAVDQEQTLYDEECSELDQESESEDEIFCIWVPQEYSQILNLAGDADTQYDTARKLNMLGDIRYADVYWFGLKTEKAFFAE